MKDLSMPTKLMRDKLNEELEFSPTQVVSILVQNWVLMNKNLHTKIRKWKQKYARGGK
jgi:hypothetical protein